MNHRELYRRSIRVGSLILFLTLASAFAFGGSISMVLTSSGSGMFDYEVSNTIGFDVFFASGQTISLTGLSGVTGATVSGDLTVCFTSSFTSSSATLTQTPVFGSCGYTNLVNPIANLEIMSPAPLGTVDWAIQTANFGNFSGTVGGPVGAPIPEPSSLLMLGSGVLGLAGMRRKITT